MRVLIPAVSASRHPDGVTRHAANLARCLLQSPAIHQVHLALAPWQHSAIRTLLGNHTATLQLHIVQPRSSAWARNLWYWRELPALAHSLDIDLIHTSYPVPLRRSSLPCPVVTTLHDLYPWDAPRNFGYPRVLLNRIVLRQCLHSADAIACVSASTLARLATHDGAAHQKACSMPNCVEPFEASTPETAAWMRPLKQHPFLLCVAQHRHNKNLPLTLQVFRSVLNSHPDAKLLLVGSRGPESNKVETLLDKLALRSNVILQSDLTEQQMDWCYRNAAALLATSTTEGFGLPIAEAMLAGCAVVCSDIPAFRELAQEHCHLVPLRHDAKTRFRDALVEVIASKRPQPIDLPHLRARALTAQYITLYRGLLATQAMPSLHWNRTEGGLS